MNSQTWLITYLTQNGLKISPLKRFKNCEICIFRQQSTSCLVDQCPSLAVCFPMPRKASVGSLNLLTPTRGDAPCLELGLQKACGWAKKSNLWSVANRAPKIRLLRAPRLQKHDTVAIRIQPCFTQNPSHSTPGHPRKSNPSTWLPVCRTGSF